MKLNPSQEKAMQHVDGPLLVIAGAGAGKTRTLTYRIANLILEHNVEPWKILALTFTNKAAREMRERIVKLMAEKKGEPLEVAEQSLKGLTMGTFHSIFAKVLRYELDQSELPYDSDFSIFDTTDTKSIVKNILVKTFKIDKPDTEQVRSIISFIGTNKNKNISPEQAYKASRSQKGKFAADVYQEYNARLIANNAMDFDDLILKPLELFKDEQILDRYHRKWRHILCDEYQDTNGVQYQLLRTLSTKNQPKKDWNWSERSLFVVGDADQAIYSFRMADFRILLNFQKDFGDGKEWHETKTMVKLEENYRSQANILHLANELIENNAQRIAKVLRPTQEATHKAIIRENIDCTAEAAYIAGTIQRMAESTDGHAWSDFACLYRTNAQSRALEDQFVKRGIPYRIFGGLRFFDRQEIKHCLAYLKFVLNPKDTESLTRIINLPRRGIGKNTLAPILAHAQRSEQSIWDVLSNPQQMRPLAGRRAQKVQEFVDTFSPLIAKIHAFKSTDALKEILTVSGYLEMLIKGGETNRVENLEELYNACQAYIDKSGDATPSGFLNEAMLASEADKDQGDAIALMTLHASKGLEFPFVFVSGVESGLLPHRNSLEAGNDAIEEERRLLYVGITRAEERVWLTHARTRSQWGKVTAQVPSMFLKELPAPLIEEQGVGHVEPKAVARPKPKPTKQFNIDDTVFHPRLGACVILQIVGDNLLVEDDNEQQLIIKKGDLS